MDIKINKEKITRRNFNTTINELSPNFSEILAMEPSPGYNQMEMYKRLEIFDEEELELFKSIYGPEGDYDSESLTLDLGELSFIDSYGLIGLCMIMRFLRRTAYNTDVFYPLGLVLPHSEETKNYLQRIQFIDYAKRYGFPALNEGDYRYQGEKGRSDYLLELTEIKPTQYTYEVLEVLEPLAKILEKQLNFDKKDFSNFATAVAEIYWNVVEHSEDKGIITIQRYTDKARSKNFVLIAVGDLGIGVMKSLGKRYDISQWDDLMAISKAVEFGMTSKNSAGGGGLARVEQIAHQYNGYLIIRSGRGELCSYATNKVRKEVLFFPGTQICINLYQRG